MSRSDKELLDDIAVAIEQIRSHLLHGPVSVPIVLDAVSMRLLEIGEATKALSPTITNNEPSIPWREIAKLRDFLAHHYFSTDPNVVQAVVDKDLQPLADAVARLRTAVS